MSKKYRFDLFLNDRVLIFAVLFWCTRNKKLFSISHERRIDCKCRPSALFRIDGKGNYYTRKQCLFLLGFRDRVARKCSQWRLLISGGEANLVPVICKIHFLFFNWLNWKNGRSVLGVIQQASGSRHTVPVRFLFLIRKRRTLRQEEYRWLHTTSLGMFVDCSLIFSFGSTSEKALIILSPRRLPTISIYSHDWHLDFICNY